ncbi:MAG: hypothetical protein L0Y72_04130 [Gemmataceae bacterium]|nr:hypothetical protein [Gemmataceae bacterium]MCI0738207.1 hypothetical protein [Gemmataceae bacterium]
MARFCALLVCVVTVCQARSQPPSPIDVESDTRLLKQNGLATEGKELLQFFRERTLSKDQVAELANQAKMLASPQLAERKKAAAYLLKAGALSRDLLRGIVKSPGSDLETVRRAEQILAQIAAGQDRLLAIATARLVAHQPPPQTGQTLLDFIPFAADARLLEEVQKALNVVAVKDGTIEAPFLAALKDKLAAKRGAAGAAIIRAGGLAQKKTVELLLADESPQVRLAIIIALVEAQDKQAVRALIDLLPVVAKDKVWQVEDMLQRIGGEKAPDIHVGAKTPAKLAHAVWSTWWQTNQQAVSLGRLSEPPKYRGFHLVVNSGDADVRGSKIMEVRLSKQVPWQYSSKRIVTDGEYMTKDRVLVAEGNRLLERDLKGNSYWEKEFDDGIIGIQRLPRGDIFVATRRQLYLLDPVGIVVFTPKIQKVEKIDEDTDESELVTIRAAGRGRDGFMAYVNQNGECTWLDPDGLVTTIFKVGELSESGAGIFDVLPGQRILLPLPDKVAEIDADGKTVWHVKTPGANAALRLPNGHTLVASGQRVTQVDRDGREMWFFDSPGNAVRLRRK